MWRQARGALRATEGLVSLIGKGALERFQGGKHYSVSDILERFLRSGCVLRRNHRGHVAIRKQL